MRPRCGPGVASDPAASGAASLAVLGVRAGTADAGWPLYPRQGPRRVRASVIDPRGVGCRTVQKPRWCQFHSGVDILVNETKCNPRAPRGAARPCTPWRPAVSGGGRTPAARPAATTWTTSAATSTPTSTFAGRSATGFDAASGSAGPAGACGISTSPRWAHRPRAEPHERRNPLRPGGPLADFNAGDVEPPVFVEFRVQAGELWGRIEDPVPAHGWATDGRLGRLLNPLPPYLLEVDGDPILRLDERPDAFGLLAGVRPVDLPERSPGAVLAHRLADRAGVRRRVLVPPRLPRARLSRSRPGGRRGRERRRGHRHVELRRHGSGSGLDLAGTDVVRDSPYACSYAPTLSESTREARRNRAARVRGRLPTRLEQPASGDEPAAHALGDTRESELDEGRTAATDPQEHPAPVEGGKTSRSRTGGKRNSTARRSSTDASRTSIIFAAGTRTRSGSSAARSGSTSARSVCFSSPAIRSSGRR